MKAFTASCIVSRPFNLLKTFRMFFTMIMIAYGLPNIYLFLRIGKLFISNKYRVRYAIIYILLALLYPLSNAFFDGDGGSVGLILEAAGNYILTFYLYLFLSVLLFDILLIFNYIFKFISSEILKSSKFKKTALSIIILTSITVVIIGIINFNTIRVSEYNIEIPKKGSGIENLKIAFVADFHLDERTNIKYVERFVKEIKIIQPDLMLYGGDIVEGNGEDEELIRIENSLGEIETQYGVFAVLGNHEHYSGNEDGSFLRSAGMTLLTDSVVIINYAFNLAGRYDSQFRSRKSINEFIKSVNDTLPIILLDHRPTEIEEVSKTNVDIQLSGHTHNGQLFPINFIIRKMYLLNWGYEKIGNTHFFVTSGIRLWGPPVRTVGKSEIMVINITFI